MSATFHSTSLCDDFIEPNMIAERIDCPGFASAPFGQFQAGPHIFVLLIRQLSLECFYALHLDTQSGAGTSVAVMLAQMEQQSAPRNLSIERRVGLVAVIPIHLEAEKSQIEFVRLGNIKNAKNRHHFHEPNCHRIPNRPLSSAESNAAFCLPGRKEKAVHASRIKTNGSGTQKQDGGRRDKSSAVGSAHVVDFIMISRQPAPDACQLRAQERERIQRSQRRRSRHGVEKP